MVGVNGDFANTVFFLKVKKAVYPLSGLTGFPAKSVFNDPDCYVKDIWYGTVWFHWWVPVPSKKIKF